MDALIACGQALREAFDMFWDVFWPLVLGFALSAIVQALVSHRSMAKLLGDDSPRSLSLAALFGIASSSCSYAAVALARAIFRKGAGFTNAMAFELASTNLVIELGIILIVLLGWQFMVAEYVGGLIMVILIALIFRLTLTPRLVQSVRRPRCPGAHARPCRDGYECRGGRLIPGQTVQWTRLHRDQPSVRDGLGIGVDGHRVIAGALAAWIPAHVWQSVFLSGHPTLAKIEGPLVGPLVAVFSFVCSVGNVPLAAVLWRGGISFGGVVSFIFADLIVLPVLDIYRRYYGGRVALYILGTFYLTMAAAGYVVEVVFGALGIIPTNRAVRVITEGPTWNYTSVLNIIFLIVGGALVARFVHSGGPAMLRMMSTPEGYTADGGDHPGHHGEMHQPHHESRATAPLSASLVWTAGSRKRCCLSRASADLPCTSAVPLTLGQATRWECCPFGYRYLVQWAPKESKTPTKLESRLHTHVSARAKRRYPITWAQVHVGEGKQAFFFSMRSRASHHP